MNLILIVLVLSQMGLSSKNYCELAGRTEPVVADIIMAFVELGTIDHITN